MDQALVERARSGDREAYERLARGSVDRLYAIAFQITRDPDRADDAVQQALVEMWRDLPSLRVPSRFEGWTLRLVTRACLGLDISEPCRGDVLGPRRIDILTIDP